MDANALRALADALSSGTHYVESPELHEAMMRAADYLRACADAQPAPAVPQAEPKREPTSEFSGPERVRWNDQLGAEVDDAIHCAGETRDMGARLSRAER